MMFTVGNIGTGRSKMPKPIFEDSEGLQRRDLAFWERILGSQEERLRPALADVPKQLKKLGLDLWFPGECYFRAIWFIRRNPKLPTAEYILGDALGGGFGQHGWVELEDLVFDGVLQEWYQKEDYYALEHAKPWYRFSRPATMYLQRQMYKLPKYTYRWDWWLHLPWGKNTPISLEQAKACLKQANAQRLAIFGNGAAS